jgi:hypothetical protein
VAFCIFQVELRRWLTSKDPDLHNGMAELQRALQLFMRGLTPTSGALRVAERPRRARRQARQLD